MLPLFPANLNPRWIAQSISFVARSGLQYLVDATVTISLPSTPRSGDTINIIVPYGSTVITFNAVHKINSNSGSYLFYANSTFTSQLTLLFLNTTLGWVVNNNLSLPQLGNGTFNRLNYIDSTDKNDAFYYLGSAKNASSYSNPYNVSVGCVAASLYSGAYSTAENVPTNATNGEIFTADVANQWISIDIGYNNSARKIRPLNLLVYSSNAGNAVCALRNFSVQGTNTVSAWVTGNTGGTWTTIKAYSADTRMSTSSNVAALYSFTDAESPTFYRYFRISQTGLNAYGQNTLCTGRWCVYGDIINF